MLLVVFRARSVLVQHGRVHPPIRKKAGVGSLDASMQTLFVHCTLLDEVYQLVDPQIWFC